MSTILTTEAVVLRSMNYKESSKIVTFYTRERGKLSGLVKGARRGKNPFGSALEPMSYVTLVVYTRPGRGLQTVSQCDIIRPFRRLSGQIEAMAAGMSIIELMNLIASEEEHNVPMFELLLAALDSLDRQQRRPAEIFAHFQVKLMDLLGFRPALERCIVCAGSLAADGKPVAMHIARGGPLCQRCEGLPGPSMPVPFRTLELLREFCGSEFGPGVVLTTQETVRELEPFLRSYLQYHVTGAAELKSARVFSKILEL